MYIPISSPAQPHPSIFCNFSKSHTFQKIIFPREIKLSSLFISLPPTGQSNNLVFPNPFKHYLLHDITLLHFFWSLYQIYVLQFPFYMFLLILFVLFRQKQDSIFPDFLCSSKLSFHSLDLVVVFFFKFPKIWSLITQFFSSPCHLTKIPNK